MLSIGLQQLKQDMRYRVKVADLNEEDRPKNSKKKRKTTFTYVNDSEGNENSSLNEKSLHEKQEKYLIQNWQFEIRKLTYEDAGTYTCLLPLVTPITKNVTLQVIRK